MPVAVVGAAGAAGLGASAADAVPSGETVRAPLPRREPTSDPHPVDRPPRPGPAVPFVPAARGGRRTPWLIGAAILGLAVLVAAVGAYLLLPSAKIVVTPRPERVGPIHLTVVADPDATQPNPTTGVVPAKEVSIPVAVNDTFSATGKRVATTSATGVARFENRDPTSVNRSPPGASSGPRVASGSAPTSPSPSRGPSSSG